MFNLRDYLLTILVGLCLLSSGLVAANQQHNSSNSKQQTPASTEKRVEDEPGSWKEIGSPEGRYTIQMPGEPKHKTLPNDEGERVEYLSSLETKAAMYSVWYSDYRRALSKPEQIRLALRFARDYGLTEGKGTLIGESEIVLGDILGHESTIELKEGIIWKVRMYWLGRRFYQVSLWVSKDQFKGHADYYDSLAAKYFASFKITPRSGTPTH